MSLATDERERMFEYISSIKNLSKKYENDDVDFNSFK